MQVFRIASAPPSESFYRKYGFKRNPSRSMLASEINFAWANISKIFVSKGVPSRYSNGYWPVLYSSKDIQTAQCEKAYWLTVLLFKKIASVPVVKCVEYEVKLHGSHQDFSAKPFISDLIVHPTDYSFCHQLGKDAIHKKLDFIVVPSARRVSGINIPILSRAAVVDVVRACSCEFFWTGSEVIYSVKGTANSVSIDDVYGMIARSP